MLAVQLVPNVHEDSESVKHDGRKTVRARIRTKSKSPQPRLEAAEFMVWHDVEYAQQAIAKRTKREAAAQKAADRAANRNKDSFDGGDGTDAPTVPEHIVDRAEIERQQVLQRVTKGRTFASSYIPGTPHWLPGFSVGNELRTQLSPMFRLFGSSVDAKVNSGATEGGMTEHARRKKALALDDERISVNTRMRRCFGHVLRH